MNAGYFVITVLMLERFELRGLFYFSNYQHFLLLKLNQFGKIFEILQIFKIEPHPIGIKLIPTQIMENLNIQHYHPKTRML